MARKSKIGRYRYRPNALPMLRNQSWVHRFLDQAYENAKRDPTVAIAWLINGIATDGLQMRVLMVTCTQANVGKRQPVGVQGLKRRKYSGLRTRWDPQNDYHSRGLFMDTEALQANSPPVHLIPVDPGRKKAATWVRPTVDRRQPNHEVRALFRSPDVRNSSGNYLTSRYETDAKIVAARQFEHV